MSIGKRRRMDISYILFASFISFISIAAIIIIIIIIVDFDSIPTSTHTIFP